MTMTELITAAIPAAMLATVALPARAEDLKTEIGETKTLAEETLVPGGIIATRASQCGDLEAFVSPQYWRGLKERVAWRAPGVTKVEDHIVVRNEALEDRAVDQKTFNVVASVMFAVGGAPPSLADLHGLANRYR
jgi:hypothetical protein